MAALDLENIAVNFVDESKFCSSKYQGKIYYIPWFSDLDTLKTEFETAYSTSVEDCGILLSNDENGGVGELVVTHHKVSKTINGIEGTSIETKHVKMEDIATNHATLLTALQAARAVIEAEITSQMS